MEDEESCYNSMSEYSYSGSHSMAHNDNSPQILQERYRQIINSHLSVTYFNREQLFTELNTKLPSKDRIKALLDLGSYIKHIKRSNIFQDQLIENINFASLIRDGLGRRVCRQLKYETLNLVSIVVTNVGTSLPLFQLLSTSYPLLLRRCIEQMVQSENSHLNKKAIMIIHRMMRLQNREITEYILKEKVIVTLYDLIKQKKIQKIKIWFCEIVNFVVGAYVKETCKEEFNDREFEVVIELITEMAQRKRSSIFVRGVSNKIVVFFNRKNIQFLQLNIENVNKFIKVIRVFSCVFLRVVNKVMPLLTLDPDVLEIIIQEVQFTLGNEENQGHNLITEIVIYLYDVKTQLKQDPWTKLKGLSMKLLKLYPLLEGQSKTARIDLYQKMLQHWQQLFTFSKDFVIILLRLTELRVDQVNFIRRYANSIDRTVLKELYDKFKEFLNSSKGQHKGKSIIRRLSSIVKGNCLELMKKQYPVLYFIQ